MNKLLSITISFSLLLLLSGCGHSVKEDEGHDHAHEAEEHAGHSHVGGLPYAVYTDNFELFADISPLIVGDSAIILAHITRLDGFRPVQNGVVVLSGVCGSNRFSVVVNGPEEVGIYRLKIPVFEAKTVDLTIQFKDSASMAEFKLSSIPVYADHHDAHEALESADEAVPLGAITFTKEQSWQIDFATSKVVTGVVGQVVRASAKVLSAQNDESVVVAKTSGVVHFGQGIKPTGSAVKQSEALVSVSGSGMSENNISVKYSEVKANYDQARQEYERHKKLVADKLVSQEQFSASEARYLIAKSQYDNLENGFSTGKQSVSSPRGGFIGQWFVSEGDFVEAGSPIVKIVGNRELVLEAQVPVRYYSMLPAVKGVNVRTLSDSKVYSMEELGGKFISYGHSLRPGEQLIPVTFTILNNGMFVSGSIVDAYIKMAGSEKNLSIPSTALLEEMGTYHVFVQVTPEKFIKREVTIGESDGVQTVITSGLKPEERVVSKGAIFVKLAQSSGKLDAHSGHVH